MHKGGDSSISPDSGDGGGRSRSGSSTTMVGFSRGEGDIFGGPSQRTYGVRAQSRMVGRMQFQLEDNSRVLNKALSDTYHDGSWTREYDGDGEEDRSKPKTNQKHSSSIPIKTMLEIKNFESEAKEEMRQLADVFDRNVQVKHQQLADVQKVHFGGKDGGTAVSSGRNKKKGHAAPTQRQQSDRDKFTKVYSDHEDAHLKDVYESNRNRRGDENVRAEAEETFGSDESGEEERQDDVVPPTTTTTLPEQIVQNWEELSGQRIERLEPLENLGVVLSEGDPIPVPCTVIVLDTERSLEKRFRTMKRFKNLQKNNGLRHCRFVFPPARRAFDIAPFPAPESDAEDDLLQYSQELFADGKNSESKTPHSFRRAWFLDNGNAEHDYFDDVFAKRDAYREMVSEEMVLDSQRQKAHMGRADDETKVSTSTSGEEGGDSDIKDDIQVVGKEGDSADMSIFDFDVTKYPIGEGSARRPGMNGRANYFHSGDDVKTEQSWQERLHQLQQDRAAEKKKEALVGGQGKNDDGDGSTSSTESRQSEEKTSKLLLEEDNLEVQMLAKATHLYETDLFRSLRRSMLNHIGEEEEEGVQGTEGSAAAATGIQEAGAGGTSSSSSLSQKKRTQHQHQQQASFFAKFDALSKYGKEEGDDGGGIDNGYIPSDIYSSSSSTSTADADDRSSSSTAPSPSPPLFRQTRGAVLGGDIFGADYPSAGLARVQSMERNNEELQNILMKRQQEEEKESGKGATTFSQQSQSHSSSGARRNRGQRISKNKKKKNRNNRNDNKMAADGRGDTAAAAAARSMEHWWTSTASWTLGVEDSARFLHALANFEHGKLQKEHYEAVADQKKLIKEKKKQMQKRKHGEEKDKDGHQDDDDDDNEEEAEERATLRTITRADIDRWANDYQAYRDLHDHQMMDHGGGTATSERLRDAYAKSRDRPNDVMSLVQFVAHKVAELRLEKEVAEREHPLSTNRVVFLGVGEQGTAMALYAAHTYPNAPRMAGVAGLGGKLSPPLMELLERTMNPESARVPVWLGSGSAAGARGVTLEAAEETARYMKGLKRRLMPQKKQRIRNEEEKHDEQEKGGTKSGKEDGEEEGNARKEGKQEQREEPFVQWVPYGHMSQRMTEEAYERMAVFVNNVLPKHPPADATATAADNAEVVSPSSPSPSSPGSTTATSSARPPLLLKPRYRPTQRGGGRGSVGGGGNRVNTNTMMKERTERALRDSMDRIKEEGGVLKFSDPAAESPTSDRGDDDDEEEKEAGEEDVHTRISRWLQRSVRFIRGGGEGGEDNVRRVGGRTADNDDDADADVIDVEEGEEAIISTPSTTTSTAAAAATSDGAARGVGDIDTEEKKQQQQQQRSAAENEAAEDADEDQMTKRAKREDLLKDVSPEKRQQIEQNLRRAKQHVAAAVTTATSSTSSTSTSTGSAAAAAATARRGEAEGKKGGRGGETTKTWGKLSGAKGKEALDDILRSENVQLFDYDITDPTYDDRFRDDFLSPPPPSDSAVSPPSSGGRELKGGDVVVDSDATTTTTTTTTGGSERLFSSTAATTLLQRDDGRFRGTAPHNRATATSAAYQSHPSTLLALSSSAPAVSVFTGGSTGRGTTLSPSAVFGISSLLVMTSAAAISVLNALRRQRKVRRVVSAKKMKKRES